jgi:DNA-binding Lrp family transcriptional regulator
MKGVRLDNKDRKLLKLLANNSRTPLEKLAREVGLGCSATWKRIKRMEREGVLLGYTISVNQALLGKEVVAFMLVGSSARKERELVQTLERWPEVCEIHEVSSEGGGLLLKIRTRDHRSLTKIKDRIAERAPEANIRILEVARTHKENSISI